MIGGIRNGREMERWVPGGPAAMDVAFPLVPIGDLLHPRREVVSDAQFADFQPITIHFDGSVDPRDRTEPFKGSMFAAYPGDVVFSKIDVRNGAIAIIPPKFGKVVVTNEYPIHVPDTKQVDPRYLALLLRSPNFLHLLKSAASGTSGRKRVDADNFGELEIPLPDLSEQTALLDAYEKGIMLAVTVEAEAQQAESNSIRAFEAELGLTPPANLPRKLLQIARFSEIERWSHEGILDRRLLAAAGNGKERFPIATLGDVIADLENGWSPQCLDRAVEAEEWGVLKLGAVSFGEYNERENKALPPHLKPQPELEIKEGNILISRANVLRLVGACAIVRKTRSNLMLCDKIFRVVFLKDSPIAPEFLVEVMKLPSVRQHIEAAATGTYPTMKNISKSSLLELTFAVPQGPDGLKIQRELVSKLQDVRNSIALRLKEAAMLRSAAWSNFLNAVFH